jgi:sulfonate transport system substrate-binding protein
LKKRFTHTRLLGLIAGLVICGAVSSGCGGTDASQPGNSQKTANDLTLHVGVQKDGVQSLLQSSGQLNQLPYKVAFAPFAYGPPLVEAVGAGKVDVGEVGNTPPIFGGAAGSQFRVIASLQKRNHTDDSLLLPQTSQVRSIQDLRGKRIAVAKGSSAHPFLLNLLQRAGVGVNEVRISFLSPSDALAAFRTGQVDAWAAWEPYVSQAEQQAGARVLTAGPPDEVGTSFEIASSKALADPAKRAALADFVQRLQRAYSWGTDHPDQFAAAWHGETQLPEAITRLAAPKVAADILPVNADQIDAEQHLADSLQRAGIIPTTVRFHDLVQPVAPGLR